MYIWIHKCMCTDQKVSDITAAGFASVRQFSRKGRQQLPESQHELQVMASFNNFCLKNAAWFFYSNANIMLQFELTYPRQ